MDLSSNRFQVERCIHTYWIYYPLQMLHCIWRSCAEGCSQWGWSQDIRRRKSSKEFRISTCLWAETRVWNQGDHTWDCGQYGTGNWSHSWVWIRTYRSNCHWSAFYYLLSLFVLKYEIYCTGLGLSQFVKLTSLQKNVSKCIDTCCGMIFYQVRWQRPGPGQLARYVRIETTQFLQIEKSDCMTYRPFFWYSLLFKRLL